MAISFQIENEECFLKVVAKGKDDDLNEVLAYSNAVVEAAIHHKSKRILCDERELEYSISVIDTFRLAESASIYANNLSRIAIVCDPKYLVDGKFYETVASNRGLFVRVTANYEEAVEWLK
jgi:hypothetical protein